MNNSELNKLKRCAVARAWLDEKLRICKGEGVMNWLVIDQDEMLNYNAVSGFVGQFLNDVTDDTNIKVQLLNMRFEFMHAHDRRKNHHKTGLVNIEDGTIKPSSTVPVLKLSDPSYLGYLDSHRNLFVGQDTGFGLKVSATKHSNQALFNSNKNKFGLDSHDDSNSSGAGSDVQQRLKKYGF